MKKVLVVFIFCFHNYAETIDFPIVDKEQFIDEISSYERGEVVSVDVKKNHDISHSVHFKLSHFVFMNQTNTEGIGGKKATIGTNPSSGFDLELGLYLVKSRLSFKAVSEVYNIIPDQTFSLNYSKKGVQSYRLSYLSLVKDVWLGGEIGFNENLYLQTPGANQLKISTLRRLSLGLKGMFEGDKYFNFEWRVGLLAPYKNNFANLDVGHYLGFGVQYFFFQSKQARFSTGLDYNFENHNPENYKQTFHQLSMGIHYNKSF